jgi:glucose-6-phosphate-specific signal transduction histidine kinase
MTMFSETDKERLEKAVREQQRLAESRRFTLDYQLQQEQKENIICHPRLAPATDAKYAQAVFNWAV